MKIFPHSSKLMLRNKALFFFEVETNNRSSNFQNVTAYIFCLPSYLSFNTVGQVGGYGNDLVLVVEGACLRLS